MWDLRGLQCFYSFQRGLSSIPTEKLDNCLLARVQQSYYHPFCLIDYNNQTSIKVCWEGDNTVSLPDLRTEDSDVSSVWNSWITSLVSTYNIDGLRVDSAQQVDNAFFPPFQSAGMCTFSKRQFRTNEE